jgi:ascorbate-specific PTS system EIIC-type component UlaA
MNRSPGERAKYILAILFAAAPFAFGIIRRVQTGHDFRLLWMAVASFIGALIVMVIRKRQKPNSVFASSVITFVISALLAASTGFMLGATAGPGTWMVAVVLALCWAASYALYNLSRSSTLEARQP